MVFYGMVNLIAYVLELVGLIPPEEDVLAVQSDAYNIKG